MALVPRTKYLTLHGVGRPPSDVAPQERPYWLDTAVFDRLVARLADVEARHGVEIHVTSDDGYASDYTHVFRALTARGRHGHFFPIGDRIGSPGCVTAAQLREMADAGMDIGTHGDRHVDLRLLDGADLSRELQTAKLRLQTLIGRPVTSVSIPFGTFDTRVVDHARSAGYARIFTSAGGLATATVGLIPRTTVKAGFEPDHDLERLVGARSRLRSAVVDRVRRWRYAG